jgi:hypothetical protein
LVAAPFLMIFLCWLLKSKLIWNILSGNDCFGTWDSWDQFAENGLWRQVFFDRLNNSRRLWHWPYIFT